MGKKNEYNTSVIFCLPTRGGAELEWVAELECGLRSQLMVSKVMVISVMELSWHSQPQVLNYIFPLLFSFSDLLGYSTNFGDPMII